AGGIGQRHAVDLGRGLRMVEEQAGFVKIGGIGGADRHVLRERRVVRITDAQNLPGDKAGGVVEVQRPVSGVHVAGNARGQVFAFRLILDSHVYRAVVAVQAAVNAHAAGYWRALCRDVFGAHAVLQQQAVAGVDVGAVVNFQQGGARVGAAGERG